MLNGIDPILIFNFKKLAPDVQATIAAIPVVSQIVQRIDLPAIPLYLSEIATGIYIETEDKSVDIETTTETLTNGTEPDLNQRGIQSTVKINMIANQDSIGLALLSALSDLIFPKVTSKEYSITYLHGAVTVFAGLLHSFSISQNSGNTLYNVSMELIRPGIMSKLPIPVVSPVTGAVPL